MAAASASSSSISSAAFHPKKYDVFISFRGEDTRSNFTSHLRDALRRKGIEIFIDDELHRGEEISPALFKAIEESHVSVIVFSENYASSKWCLDELVKILQCKQDQEQIVIPVFYKVDPSHVRRQTGSYKAAFAKHEGDFKSKSNQDKLKKWKASLFEAANLAGMDSRIYRDESKLIQKIVKDVLQKLDHKYPPRELKCPFGINENLAPTESLLREVQTIGIWGMGGIGKTTIAKWLFDKYSSQYEGSCFLANIREKAGKHGQELYNLRNELVSKLLEDDDLNMRITSADSTLVKSRLCRKRVFIVLDDVSTSKQLEYLVGELRSGSRIVITTRDKHVLIKGGVDAIHKVKGLNFQESLQIFSLNAFNQIHPIMGYEELSKRAVDYAKGMPLALEVLGSFLHSKSENEWESALTKLKRIPNEEIQRVLRLSYDGLSYEDQAIFLDIACFLKGEHEEHIISLLDSFDFYGVIGLRTLQDNALITIKNNVVWMHDLIQEMGWEIVRQESIKEPGRRSRLWDPKEVYDVLKNNRGTEAVEGIIVDMSQIRDLHLSVDTFKKMTDLRFLKFFSPLGVTYSSVHLPSGLRLFSDKLCYLEWNGCLSKSLQLNCFPEKLVELLMPNSHVEKLWDGVQDFVNLKRINLRGCRWLMELPDFSLASNLEEVDLSNCESLCHVHPSILSLHTLVTLYLNGCKELKSLESEVHLRSLRVLNVDGCSSLKEFSVSSEEITFLDLSSTRIEILHSSIGRLSRLENLVLRGLRLQNLPNELSCLRNLWLLDLSDCFGQVNDKQKLYFHFDGLQSLEILLLNHCSILSELPDNINVLSSLIWLVLTGSNVECLPASIKQLTRLQYLCLRDCKRLGYLPELPQSITYLDATNCASLETVIPSRTSRLLKEKNEYVSFQNCVKLNERALSSIMEDTHFSIKQTAYEIVLGGRLRKAPLSQWYDFHLLLPGSRVPEWFKYARTTEASITIELAPPSQLLGFVFCIVLSPFPSNANDHTSIVCECYSEDGKKLGKSTTVWFNKDVTELNSDHVYLWNDRCSHILNGIKEIRGNDQRTCNSKASFEFIVKTRSSEFDMPFPRDQFVSIKECGVCPIYASEDYNFMNQMELKSESGDKNKRLKMSGWVGS